MNLLSSLYQQYISQVLTFAISPKKNISPLSSKYSSKSEVFNIHNFFIKLTDILHSFHDSSFSSKISFNDLLISFPHSFIDLTPSTPVKHVITMGQQLSSSIDINEPRASLEFPRWYFLRIFLFIILQVHT